MRQKLPFRIESSRYWQPGKRPEKKCNVRTFLEVENKYLAAVFWTPSRGRMADAGSPVPVVKLRNDWSLELGCSR